MFFEGRDSILLYKAALEVYAAIFACPEYATEIGTEGTWYWHKNYGLVAYNLMNTDKNDSAGVYKQIVKEQWQAYIDSGAEDPQKKDMQGIVNSILL